jgi:hypothetical protein
MVNANFSFSTCILLDHFQLPFAQTFLLNRLTCCPLSGRGLATFNKQVCGQGVAGFCALADPVLANADSEGDFGQHWRVSPVGPSQTPDSADSAIQLSNCAYSLILRLRSVAGRERPSH